MKSLPERKKSRDFQTKSRLFANITLSVPLLGAAPASAAAKEVRFAPAHFGAAFLRHTRASRHPPAQTHTHSGSQQAAHLKKGAVRLSSLHGCELSISGKRHSVVVFKAYAMLWKLFKIWCDRSLRKPAPADELSIHPKRTSNRYEKSQR